MNDVIARWNLIAHAPPAPSEVYDLLAVGGEMAAEVGALRERNALLETAGRQGVVEFIEQLASRDCMWVRTRHRECDDTEDGCLYCRARRVFEGMRAEG